MLLGAAVAAVTAATLLPADPGAQEPVPFWCIACGAAELSHLLLNGALFVPVGAGLHLAAPEGRSPARALVRGACAGLLLSGAVELLQLIVPGRYPTLGDVISNGAGAGLGAAAVAALPRLAFLPPGRSAVASTAAGALAGAAFLVTGMLSVPAPTGRGYVVQRGPELGHLALFGGEVLDARIGDLALPVGSLQEDGTRAVGRAIRKGVPLRVSVRGAPSTDGLAPVLRIVDSRVREVLHLGQEGMDLVLRFRTWSHRLGLDHPGVRLRGALAGTGDGDTLRLAAWRPEGIAEGRRAAAGPGPGADAGRGGQPAARRAATWCLAAGEGRTCGLGVPVGRGWALLQPLTRLAPAALRTLDGMWTGLLFLPMGFWARRRWPTAVGLGLAALGLLGAPALTPLVAPGAAEAAGAAAGLAAGAAARKAAATAAPRPEPKPHGGRA